MDANFWIAFGSVSTALAVIVALWAINGNRRAQKKEHKAKLLGKIADWVIDIKNCSLINIPFIKDITEADFKNLKASVEHNKIIKYSSLMVTGEYLKTLAVTNKLGEQIVNNITETNKAVTRYWALSSVLFGIPVSVLKGSFTGMTKSLADFLDELEKSDITTNTKKLDSETIRLATAENKLLNEVSKAISVIFS